MCRGNGAPKHNRPQERQKAGNNMNQAIDFINIKIKKLAKELHGLELSILEAERAKDSEKEAELDRKFISIENEHYALIVTRFELEQLAGVKPLESQNVRDFMEATA